MPAVRQPEAQAQADQQVAQHVAAFGQLGDIGTAADNPAQFLLLFEHGELVDFPA